MTTPAYSRIEDLLDNITTDDDLQHYTINYESTTRPNSYFVVLFKWILRLTCIAVVFIGPWTNYKLIQFFQTRPFHKESSAKWYIIFKAVLDTIYMLVSTPLIFFLTINIDIIHRNFLTCKLITYIHYLSDDLISIMLTLLCIDRMVRITCGYRLRKRFSLTVCIIITIFFMLVNIHHIIRLQHRDGFCQKAYLGVMDYDFDIYYSFIYTSLTWTIIFIASINLTVSVYCDRTRRNQLKKVQQAQEQQQKMSNIFQNGAIPIGADSDRLELIHSTDDWEDPTIVTIVQDTPANKYEDQEQQDNIDLQITVCVLITSAVFLGCNLPTFILFVMRFVHESSLSYMAYLFVYVSLLPLLIAHTISYFIFNHLAARIFPNSS